MALPDPARMGVPAWLGRSTKPSALDRAPAIVEALAGAAESWATSFTQLSGTPVEMRCKGLRLVPVADVLRDRGDAPTCAVLRAPEWNAEIGLVVERSLVGMLVEALFGGDGESNGPASTVLSPIEAQIVQLFGQQVADALQTGLAPSLRLELRFDRLLAKPDFGPLGKGEHPVGVATLSVSALGGTGGVDVLLPPALLESLSEGLADESTEQPAEHDPRWSRQLGDEVGRSMARLRATIDLPPMSLRTILQLEPGQVLALPTASGSKVKLNCGPNELFRCELGQHAGQYTVRVEDVLAVAFETDRLQALSLVAQQ